MGSSSRPERRSTPRKTRECGTMVCMFYFSERALNEIHDGRLASSASTLTGGFALRGLSLGRSSAHSTTPSSGDQVNFALKRVRKSGRRIRRDGWDVQKAGEVFDVIVTDLHVGVMPFATFGRYGERERSGGKVRTFWAAGTLPAVAAGHSELSVILIGSLDNVVNRPWSGEDEARLRVGHSHASDPGPVGRLLSWELELEEEESVQADIRKNEWVFGAPGPGEEAVAASRITGRARTTLIHDEGYAQTWERRHPLSRARVVGIARDVQSSSEQENVLLARPVLIQDLS